MDNEKNTPQAPENENWLDEILGTSDIPQELGPDELAVHAAGLTHPDDLELEQILSENWDNVDEPTVPQEVSPTPAEEAPEEQSAMQDHTQIFKPVEETQVVHMPEKKADEPKPAAEETKPAEKAPAKEKPTVRKVRPEPKKGYGMLGIPHILATVIWLVIIVAIGVTFGHTLWVSCADLMAFGKSDRQVTITIQESDDIATISKKLEQAGLIEYPVLFENFATLTGKDEDIEPGTYTLNSKYDYNAMINNMRNYGGAREEIEVMIPEGYTCAQIFELLEEKTICSVADLEEYVANGDLPDYWFLEGVKQGDRYALEGYLFPDTYRFYTNDTAENVIKKFLDGFDYRFTDVMMGKLETMEERTQLDIGIREVVIIASMIEKETASNSESYTISSVIFNRLRKPADYPYLNIDATLIYALGGNIDPETGLTKPLTSQDMQMHHEYNTYTNQGLPPGPISNPGRNSLDAALDPSLSSYYYYVYNPQAGVHIFSKTLADHEDAIKYVNSLE